jgi:hypothetical protein
LLFHPTWNGFFDRNSTENTGFTHGNQHGAGCVFRDAQVELDRAQLIGLAAIVAIHRPKLGEVAADAIEKMKVKAMPASTRSAGNGIFAESGPSLPVARSFFGKIDFPS